MSRYDRIPQRLDREPVQPLLDWSTAALAGRGYTGVAAPDLVRRRSWSTLLRIPTAQGPVWAKANARGFAAEAALLELLGAVAAEHVLPLIASRPDDGWLLLPDGGEVLESAGLAGPIGNLDSAHWVDLVRGYADLQRRMAAHLPELRDAGLPDCTPPTLADWYRQVLARADAEPHVRPLVASTWARLQALVDDTARWSAELGASRIPSSVEHNDLHSDNVFVGTPAAPGLRIFDWGDACITHPFIGLRRILLAAVDPAEQLEFPAGAAAEALLDAYLRCWLPDSQAEIPAELRRDVALATQLSFVVVAASWLRLPTFDAEFGGYFASFLTGYLSGAERL